MERQLAETSVYTGRPRFEGSNICTWIGFKHVMYLVEEAVLHQFRERGLAPRRLYEDHGLCLEIVDSWVRILHALHMDDPVTVEVHPETRPQDQEMSFGVRLFVARDERLKALAGTVKVLFRRDRGGVLDDSPPEGLSPYVHQRIDRTAEAPQVGAGPTDGRGGRKADDDLLLDLAPPESNAFVWKWRIPYFYCHFSERIQHSGYLRLMEEVVDLFLADRGISIRKLLDTHGWIPVVPEARIEILREAHMEEPIYTVYTVEEIFKNLTYKARMDCYVPRGDKLIHTATGHIVHGYAEILDRATWSLVEFDAGTMDALRGGSG